MRFRDVVAHHDGLNLAIQLLEGPGEPLLLIHGMHAEMQYWHPGFCDQLSENGFEVARFDNRDSGESTHLRWAGAPSTRRVRRDPRSAPYTLDDMADDAAAVLDALGWRSAHVVGHSLGGMIAQLFAVRHPDRVRSLTSISSTVSADVGRMRPSTILRLVRANPADFLGRPPRNAQEAARRLVRGHRVLGSPAYTLDEDWLAEIAALRFERGFDPDTHARHAAAGLASGDIRGRTAAIDVPTLVLHGAEDLLVRPEGGAATAAAIPGASLVVLAGMGHDLPAGAWTEFTTHIRAIADRA